MWDESRRGSRPLLVINTNMLGNIRKGQGGPFGHTNILGNRLPRYLGFHKDLTSMKIKYTSNCVGRLSLLEIIWENFPSNGINFDSNGVGIRRFQFMRHLKFMILTNNAQSFHSIWGNSIQMTGSNWEWKSEYQFPLPPLIIIFYIYVYHYNIDIIIILNNLTCKTPRYASRN